jgi:hypothetical protein
MAIIFPKWMKTIIPQIQESPQTLSTRDVKNTTPRPMIIKLPKASDGKEKLKIIQIKITTLSCISYGRPKLAHQKQCKVEDNRCLPNANRKNCWYRLLYPAKISFKNEGEMDFFRYSKAEKAHHQQTHTVRNSNRQKLRDFR